MSGGADLCIGFNPDFRPFCFLEAGAAQGLVIAPLKQALAEAGLAAEYVPLPLPEMQPALQDGRVDLLAGIGATPERATALDFSPPLVRTGGAWFARASAGWPDDTTLQGDTSTERTVVTPAAGPLAAHIRTHFPGLTLRTCEDYAGALALVAAGAVDAAALNLHVGNEMVAAEYAGEIAPADRIFLEIPLALAVAKGDPGGWLDQIPVPRQAEPL